ncbi:MAG: tetratricopeptide repeat protein [Lachnospiraceae bacterium]|nr:tetratricopeptide repeat protein [Lachnospiraceae bacterium]
MNIEGFFAQLDSYFQNQQLDQVEPYLLSSLEQAKEEEDYGAYLSIGNEMIGYYRSVSRFKEAFDIAEDVLLLLEEMQLESTEHFATTLLNAATAYRAAGNVRQAYQYYQQALQIYTGLLPDNDYRFAGLYNNMSLLLEQMNQNEEALDCLQKALAIVRKLENSGAEQASTLTNMALIYFKMEQSTQAGKLLEEALSIFEASGKGEETDAHYSAALAGIGEACFRMGDYPKSLASYEKALAEIKKHFGENLSYGVLCSNCATVCRALGEEEKAQDYEKKSKEIQQKLQQ